MVKFSKKLFITSIIFVISFYSRMTIAIPPHPKDEQVASQIVEIILTAHPIFHIENKDQSHYSFLKSGLLQYFQDRREKQRGLKRREMAKILNLSQYTKSLKIDEDWKNSFGPRSSKKLLDRQKFYQKNRDKIKYRDIGDLDSIATDFTNEEILRGEANCVARFKDQETFSYFKSIGFKYEEKFILIGENQRDKVVINDDEYQVKTLESLATEVVAFRLSRLLRLNLVPATDFVKSQSTECRSSQMGVASQEIPESFKQLYLILKEHHHKEKEIIQSENWKRAISQLKIFDFIGNLGRDRHHGNLFVDENSYKIMAIDHESFYDSISGIPISNPDESSLSGNLTDFCPEDLKQRLKEITRKELFSELKDILSPLEIESIWMRIFLVRAKYEIH